MAKVAGRIQTLDVSTDGGSTWTAVGGIVDGSFNGSQEELDSTAHDDGQYRTYVPGRKDFTIDVPLRWNQDDSGQAVLKAAFFAATVLTVRFRMEVGSGRDNWQASAFVTSFAPSGPNDDIASLDCSLRISSSVSPSAQS